jgi:Family of unknown function (DUF6328)
MKEPTTDPQQVLDIDDRFRSLMEGIRTTLPGVQVLFAFLLAVPVYEGFETLGDGLRTIYYIAFISSGLASVLLIAPSVHQRVRAPMSGIRRRTLEHIMVGAKVAVVGTVAAAVAIASVTYFVTSLVFDDGPAAIATTVLALVTAWSWFYLPMVSFERND